ncbi:hypothetical protein BS50DRAFT_47669 [Corynespora cassiicola Philippines]|uniref:Uncharacterized protein n=1 Tax=Corynespora cassiicola Philippines TaxID=1448308 RepID=A0A2T2NHM9_CORCC|nr:hypothetical protein BS50DRAFT_47669 [Corynespora cassiicola Philippines]
MKARWCMTYPKNKRRIDTKQRNWRMWAPSITQAYRSNFAPQISILSATAQGDCESQRNAISTTHTSIPARHYTIRRKKRVALSRVSDKTILDSRRILFARRRGSRAQTRRKAVQTPASPHSGPARQPIRSPTAHRSTTHPKRLAQLGVRAS